MSGLFGMQTRPAKKQSQETRIMCLSTSTLNCKNKAPKMKGWDTHTIHVSVPYIYVLQTPNHIVYCSTTLYYKCTIPSYHLSNFSFVPVSKTRKKKKHLSRWACQTMDTQPPGMLCQIFFDLNKATVRDVSWKRETMCTQRIHRFGICPQLRRVQVRWNFRFSFWVKLYQLFLKNI